MHETKYVSPSILAGVTAAEAISSAQLLAWLHRPQNGWTALMREVCGGNLPVPREPLEHRTDLSVRDWVRQESGEGATSVHEADSSSRHGCWRGFDVVGQRRESSCSLAKTQSDRGIPGRPCQEAQGLANSSSGRSTRRGLLLNAARPGAERRRTRRRRSWRSAADMTTASLCHVLSYGSCEDGW